HPETRSIRWRRRVYRGSAALSRLATLAGFPISSNNTFLRTYFLRELSGRRDVAGQRQTLRSERDCGRFITGWNVPDPAADREGTTGQSRTVQHHGLYRRGLSDQQLLQFGGSTESMVGTISGVERSASSNRPSSSGTVQSATIQRLIMYVPELFVESDLAKLHRLMEQYNFATLYCQPDGEPPEIVHMPFILDPVPGPNGLLLGHVARANPVWRLFDG